MADDRLYAWGNPWFRWSIVSLVVLTVAVVPGRIRRAALGAARFHRAGGIWDSICRAAGLPANWGAGSDAPEERAPSTSVVLAPAMARAGSSDADRARRDDCASSNAACATARRA